MRDRHTQARRTLQTVGFRVDADEGAHFQDVRHTHDLDHQIGPDITGPDDRHLDLTTHGYLFPTLNPTLPRPPICASTTSPDLIAAIGPSAPVRITSPAFNPSPALVKVRASQAAALSGWPRHAAPAPTE